MGAYVKNINNFPKTFGEMKYFATLSLSLSLSLSSHRSYLASKYLILNSFTKSLSLRFVQIFMPLSFLTRLKSRLSICPSRGLCFGDSGHYLSPLRIVFIQYNVT